VSFSRHSNHKLRARHRREIVPSGWSPGRIDRRLFLTWSSRDVGAPPSDRGEGSGRGLAGAHHLARRAVL